LKIHRQELFILDLLKQMEEKDKLIDSFQGDKRSSPDKEDRESRSQEYYEQREYRRAKLKPNPNVKLAKTLTKSNKDSPKRHTINYDEMPSKSPHSHNSNPSNYNSSPVRSDINLPCLPSDALDSFPGICYSPRKENELFSTKSKRITDTAVRNPIPCKGKRDSYEDRPDLEKERQNIKLETQEEILSQLDHEWIIFYKDLHFGPKLGYGVSSTVYKGTWKNNEEIVAIKVMKLVSPAKDLNDFKKELYIISQIRDPNIVLFHGFILEPKFCIVMELCENGSLYHYLKMKPDISWEKVLKWVTAATRGINILHLWKPPIVHRDLKSLNLLLDKELNIKVCDFGLSRFVAGEDSVSETDQTLQKLRGTYAYTAPEMYYSKNYTPKSDIYSMGIIIWEIVTCLLTGKHQKPYSEFTDIKHDYQIIFQVASMKKRPSISPLCPKPLEELIENCWAQDSNSRPTAAGLLESVREVRRVYKKRKSRWYHPSAVQAQTRLNE